MTLSGMVMFDNLLRVNAAFPIVCTFFPIETACSSLAEKAPEPIDITLSGITTAVALFPENALSPIIFKFSGRLMLLISLFENDPSPNASRSLGNRTDCILLLKL